MAGFHVAVIPIGRVDSKELEEAVRRAVKVLHQPLELRESLPVPRGTEDPARGQHRAAELLGHLRVEVAKLKPGKPVGVEDAAAKPPFRVDGYVFVTDVDLFTAATEGVFGALVTSKQCAVISIRRLREAFYKRKADPTRQRARMVKEILRMWGRLRGAGECPNPECVLAPSRSVPDVDAKAERYCRDCEQRLFEGRIQI